MESKSHSDAYRFLGIAYLFSFNDSFNDPNVNRTNRELRRQYALSFWERDTTNTSTIILIDRFIHAAEFVVMVQTERGAERIKQILQGENAEGAIGIRLGVKRRGCNGLSYTLNYAFEKPKKDIEMQAHGVKIFVEPMALFNVVGTVMDWEETELSSEFTFKNPNSKGECGCGESFTV
mmetsp:Transcript_17206/g.47368  ORF Transcript_17206/g.47368 Transcript_17206/m.47368 type:complete len:178 (-) Transcript_17206:2478-3011(-)